MLIYIALVSHDDESEITPIGAHTDLNRAKQLCEDYIKQNGDEVELLWETYQHTRITPITGFFCNASVKNQYGAKYVYYIRPVELGLFENNLVKIPNET